MKTSAIKKASLLAAGISVLAISGCARLTVTHVTSENKSNVEGIRYYLPKPFLQVAPRADGTVSVTVVYLPDTTKEYAIDASSWFSSYAFQISRDSLGLLSGVEYKSDTTAVAQQAFASAQGIAVQNYNLHASQLAAVQGQINTAQTAVDSATSNLAAAQAALASDTAKGAAASQLILDNSAVQQAQAKLDAAQQVLARTQTSSQNVANTITAATPLTSTAVATGSALTTPTASSTVYNLPEKFGAVLYAINETDKDLKLNAVVMGNNLLAGAEQAQSTELNEGVKADKQVTFPTVGTAMGTPTLSPSSQSVKLADKMASVKLSRPINKLAAEGFRALSDETPPVMTKIPVTKDSLDKGDKMTVKVDISTLKEGRTYKVSFDFLWPVDGKTSHDMTSTGEFKVTIAK